MLKDGVFLYLGIKGIDGEMFSNNVYINLGDEIAILHSSAALGTAKYQKAENQWNQTQNFSWRCRKTDQSVAARMERAEFLDAEGWLASNGLTGTPNEMEYKITIPDQDFRMAVTIIRSSPPYEKIPWPVNLKDDTVLDTPEVSRHHGFHTQRMGNGRFGIILFLHFDPTSKNKPFQNFGRVC